MSLPSHFSRWIKACLAQGGNCCRAKSDRPPMEQSACTWGALRERSTTIESTTTSLQAVPSEPTTVAISAPAGERTTAPMAAQDADPARARKLGRTYPENASCESRIHTIHSYGRPGQHESAARLSMDPVCQQTPEMALCRHTPLY